MNNRRGKRHHCGTCGNSYQTSSSLRRHQTIHREDNPNICPYCGKAFCCSPDVKSHVKKHCKASPGRNVVFGLPCNNDNKFKLGQIQEGKDPLTPNVNDRSAASSAYSENGTSEVMGEHNLYSNESVLSDVDIQTGSPGSLVPDVMDTNEYPRSLGPDVMDTNESPGSLVQDVMDANESPGSLIPDVRDTNKDSEHEIYIDSRVTRDVKLDKEVTDRNCSPEGKVTSIIKSESEDLPLADSLDVDSNRTDLLDESAEQTDLSESRPENTSSQSKLLSLKDESQVDINDMLELSYANPHKDDFPPNGDGLIIAAAPSLMTRPQEGDPINKHICETCNKMYKNRYNLVRHQVLHSENNPFTCFFCAKGFCTIYDLKRHMALHSKTSVMEDIVFDPSCNYDIYSNVGQLQSGNGRDNDLVNGRDNDLVNGRDKDLKLVETGSHAGRASNSVYIENVELGFKGIDPVSLNISGESNSVAHEGFSDPIGPEGIENNKRELQKFDTHSIHEIENTNSEEEVTERDCKQEDAIVSSEEHEYLTVDNGIYESCDQSETADLSKSTSKSFTLQSQCLSMQDKDNVVHPGLCDAMMISDTIDCSNPQMEIQVQEVNPLQLWPRKSLLCTVCGVICNSTEGLRRHRETHKFFKCHLCFKSFPNKSRLIRHMNVHRVDNPFICKHCGEAFDSLIPMEKHMKTHSEANVKNTGSADECIILKTNESGNHNASLDSGSPQNECISWEDGNHLDSNIMLDTACDSNKSERFECVNPKEKVPLPEEYDGVQSDVTRPHNFRISNFVCEKCAEIFKSRHGLRKHMKIPHVHGCTICPRSFRYMERLRKHQRWHKTGEIEKVGLFDCNKCGKCFESVEILGEHKKSHKIYCCILCHKSFSSTHTLNQHMNIHRPDNPNICLHHCGRGFDSASHLKEHLKAVHKNRATDDCDSPKLEPKITENNGAIWTSPGLVVID